MDALCNHSAMQPLCRSCAEVSVYDSVRLWQFDTQSRDIYVYIYMYLFICLFFYACYTKPHTELHFARMTSQQAYCACSTGSKLSWVEPGRSPHRKERNIWASWTRLAFGFYMYFLTSIATFAAVSSTGSWFDVPSSLSALIPWELLAVKVRTFRSE